MVQLAIFFQIFFTFINAIKYCVQQGEGNCNLAIVGGTRCKYKVTLEITEAIYLQRLLAAGNYVDWTQVKIFNNTCHEIGSYNKRPTQDTAIYSELPWAVVITHLVTDGDYNNVGICYSNYCYRGHFACHREHAGGLWWYNICMHGFPC
jgi:hypothetical protein